MSWHIFLINCFLEISEQNNSLTACYRFSDKNRLQTVDFSSSNNKNLTAFMLLILFAPIINHYKDKIYYALISHIVKEQTCWTQN